jgi:hypothetical protein
MADFAIMSPKYGLAENIPSVLLSEAFLAKDSVNVHERYGRYDRMRGRLPQLTDASGVKIKTPTDVYEITSINTTTKTITITGDHSAGNTALAIGATIRINGGTTEANNTQFTVTSLPTTSTIVVSETLSTTGATKGNVFVGTTPVIRYHRHTRKATATEYLLLGTKYHILLWTESDKSMTVKWTCVSPSEVERWEIIDHLRNVYATNNSDFVIWWDVDGSPSNSFAALDNADGIDYEGTANRLTICKHIWSYETYLFLGHTTENATLYPQRIRWASRGTGGATIDFDENGDGDAGSKEFTNTPGFMNGFASHGDDIVVAKEDSMHRGQLVEEDTVFIWEEYKLKVGNLSADSLINDKSGRLYWMGSDLTIREIETPRPISTAVDITVKGMNTSKTEFIQSTYIEEFEQIWWAITHGTSDTNNKIVVFHPNTGASFILDIPIRAFGDFTQQTAYTYGTLPYGTYANWGAAWGKYNVGKNVVGFPLDIAADYEGSTFNLHDSSTDDGDDFTGSIILSSTMTNPKSLNLYKRVNNGADLFFNRKGIGNASLYCKRDNEKTWQSLGSASFVDSDEPEVVIVHIPFDKRAKTFLWKIESSDLMEFIGIVFRDFVLEESGR